MLALVSCQDKGNSITTSPTSYEPKTSVAVQATENPTGMIVEHGSVHIDKLEKRRIFVYLPPGYETDNERYPVVYMNDGRNIFQTNTSSFQKEWKVEKIIDQLVAEGRMKKVIVIGVDSSEGSERGEEYVPFLDESIPSDGKSAEEFTRYFIDTVIPYVDGTYRTNPDRDNRMIMGSSFGGVQALWMGYHHPETFSSIGAVSTSTWVAKGRLFEELAKEKEKPNVKIWLDMGYAEGMLIEPLVDILKSKGFVYGQDLFFQMDILGNHDENSWSRRVHSPLLMFAGKAPEQAVELAVDDSLMIFEPDSSYIRLNPVTSMDNGMDYSVSDGADYKVLNPEVGRVDESGKVKFLKPESLDVEVTYQGITVEHKVDYDRLVRILKNKLESLVTEEKDSKIKVLLKPTAENLKATTKEITDIAISLESTGLYTIEEVREDYILLSLNTK
ncbi:alpha/beta hydrolase [Paenibacillus segetis]|nr:alpha/beta hydrolase-fold protein [Paenibacillus segetis]